MGLCLNAESEMNILFCSKCGNEINRSARFCENCGKRIKQKKTSNNTNYPKANKRKMWIVICTVLILSICVGSGFTIFYQKNIYPKTTYNNALALMKSKKYSEAIAEFEKINAYKDSEEKLSECKKLYKYSQMPDVEHDGLPGNVIENYNWSGYRLTAPFVAEFVYNNNFYAIYDDKDGLHITSKDSDYNHTLPGYSYPNIYNGNLYCYKSKSQKIVSFDIKSILCDIENEKEVVELKKVGLNHIESIFVNNNKILLLDNFNNRKIVLVDLHGNKIFDFSDNGDFHVPIMTSESSLTYVYEPTVLATFNFETQKKSYENFTGKIDEITLTPKYSSGRYYFNIEDKVFDKKSNKMSNIDEPDLGYIYAAYKDFFIASIIYSHNEVGLGIGYPYSINILTGEKYRLPLENIEMVNFGKDDKMYICGYNGNYEDDWVIYRMNLDCTNVEKIGVYKH